MPIISMKPLVPSRPGPPKDPKSFWAPWPAISEPCTARTIVGADSFTLWVSIFEVVTLTPSLCCPRTALLLRTVHLAVWDGEVPVEDVVGVAPCLESCSHCWGVAGDEDDRDAPRVACKEA